MPTVLHDLISVIKDRKSGGSELSASEQTRLSWARLVQSREELPPAYHSFFETRPAGEAFPYTVLTPTFAGFMRRETEKLVCCLDERLYILEKTSNELKCTSLALTDLHCVEVGAVLLNAWIKLQGITAEKALTTIVLRFNAVGDRLFLPFLNQFRETNAGPIDRQHPAELSQLDETDLLSFKFRNYTYHSLLPGTQVVAVLTQPEIGHILLRVGRWSFRHTVTTTHLLILTEHELIIIRDDPDSPPYLDNTRYGGIWDYIPLNKIERITWRERDAEALTVSLELPRGDRVESLFATNRRGEVERFLNQVIEWAPEATLQRAGFGA
ncbi:MAG TPA: hypothetical protein VLG46_07185 [Anaerolineae bacterium]|nr:hypothetical protein [Anaerolineae bacterium]